MQKGELRKLFQAQRKALSTAEYNAKCVQVYNRFFSDVDLKKINVIHTFLSIDNNKEPDTWLIINKLHDEYSHVRIAVPRIIPKTNDLENFYLDSLTQLVTNEWGIPEPVSGTKTPSEQIDLVLVPLLIFDAQGHRVGYGKGFYDKFLGQCRSDTLRVGLSLFPPVEKIDDVNDFDVALDCCVTPEKMFVFKPQVPAGSGSGTNPVPR
jgi:5-formyltetrahydrofolate cyclo-ligase